MNSAPQPIPGLRMLYDRDLVIRRGANMLGFGLMIAAGVWWVTRPYPGVPATVDRTFEEMARPWGIAGGFALAALGGLILLWRWLRVRKILTQGKTIQAMVEDLEVETWQSSANVDQSHGMKSKTMRSYYATLRYTAQGAERKVRQKLPNSGFTFGLIKGRQTEVMVLDEAPLKPLLRAVYAPKAPGNGS
jgi:hypothetical protein